MASKKKQLSQISHPPIRELNDNELLIDGETRLEQFLYCLFHGSWCFGAFFTFFLINEWSEETELSTGLVPVSLGLFLFAAIVYTIKSNVSDVFVLSLVRERLLRWRYVGRFRWERTLCSLSKLTAVVVTTRRNSSDSGVSWTYGVSFLKTNGRLISIFPSSYYSSLGSAQDAALRISKFAKLGFYAGSPKESTKVRRGTKGYEIEYRPHWLDLAGSRPFNAGWIIVFFGVVFLSCCLLAKIL